MMKTAQKKVAKKIVEWATRRFGGSGDLEKEDAVHVCDYFTQTYSQNPAVLKDTLDTFKKRLETIDPGWALTRHPIATTAPAFAESGQPESLRLSLTQLGFLESSSVKGKSKMIHVYECIQNFLEKPYNSMEHPLFVQLDADAVIGAPIKPFSVVHRIGFSKSLAAKAIIIGAIECGLGDEDVLIMKDHFEALYSMNAVLQESDIRDQEARFGTLRKKFEESSRPRPDPFNVLFTFKEQAKADGKPLSEVMGTYIEDFNSGSDVEAKQLSELEQCVVKILPELLPATQQSIEYHWDNYKSKQSGLPLAHLGAKAVISGTKPRIGEESALWVPLLKPSPEARHAYITRRIGIFLARLKEANRLGKKVNLGFQSETFRDKLAPDDAWELAALFAHFLPEFVRNMSDSKAEELVSKFRRGALDQELLEKTRTKFANLEWRHFRFLAQLGVEGVAAASPSHESASPESAVGTQTTELKQYEAKVHKEVHKWETYNLEVQVAKAQQKGEYLEARDKAMDSQKKAVEAAQNLRFPVRSFEDASLALPFGQACLGTWCDHVGVDKGEAWQVYWVNSTISGSNAFHCVDDALNKIIAPQLASAPERSCAILMAPNVGRWGNQFHEDEIMKHADEIEKLFANPDLRLLFRRITLFFSEDTVPSQSNRPGSHPGWMLLSDQMAGANGPSPVYKSEFCKSSMWVRRSISGVPMLGTGAHVDPTAKDPLHAPTAKQLETKAARRRQWLAGWKVLSKVHDVLLLGLGLDSRSVLTWIDVLAYDHSLSEAILNKTDAKWPREQVVMTVWSTAVFRAIPGEDKMHVKTRIEKWLKNAIRRKTQQAALDGIIAIDNWVPIPESSRDADKGRPTYDIDQFKLCYPSSARHLPFRQSFVDTATTLFTDPGVKALWDEFVAAHNAKWNPLGAPYNHKRPLTEPEVTRAAKQPKTIGAEPDGPSTVEELEKKKGKCASWEVQGQTLLATKDGELWVWGVETGTLGQEDALCLLWGEHFLGDPANKLAAEEPLRAFRFAIEDVSVEGGYATKEQTGDRAVPPVLRPLSEFLDLLETKCEVDISSTTFACHKIAAQVQRDAGNDVTGRTYSIQNVELCMFKPGVPARRTEAKWGDVGSLLCVEDAAGQWDWQTGEHIKGHVRLRHYLKYGDTEQHQGILPHKPAIYLERPVAIAKGTLIRLA